MKSSDKAEEELRQTLAQWRPLRVSDAESLHQLISRIELKDNPPYRTTLGEVRGWLQDTDKTRGRIGIAADGPRKNEPICYAIVTLSDNSRECRARGGVCPDYRGLGVGGAVVSWQVEQGTTLLRDVTGEGGRILTQVAGEQNELQVHLTRMGFSWARSSYELRRELSDLPLMPQLGTYYSVELWSQEWDHAARRLYARLIEEQWSMPGQSNDEWSMGMEAFRPEWSFVALDKTGDRPSLVGFVRVSAYPEDWEALGWSEGYIDLLGVEEFPGSNAISKALVIASMDSQAASGMRKVATGVGVASNAGALSFYEELGFNRSFQTRTYSYSV